MHFFNPNIANITSVEEAIMINHLYYWQFVNESNKRNFHDGKYWTYNSIAAFKKIFFYWSISKIRRILDKLEERKIIISGCYNNTPTNRTKWYSIIDSSIKQICELHLSQVENQSFDFDKSSITNNNNTNNNTCDSTESPEDQKIITEKEETIKKLKKNIEEAFLKVCTEFENWPLQRKHIKELADTFYRTAPQFNQNAFQLMRAAMVLFYQKIKSAMETGKPKFFVNMPFRPNKLNQVSVLPAIIDELKQMISQSAESDNSAQEIWG